EMGGPEFFLELFRERLDHLGAILLARLDDLHQRRPAERRDAKKAATEGRALLAGELGRVDVGEHEGAGHRPFAGLGRPLEHEGVGRIGPDGAQKLHRRGPPLSGSSQDGEFNARSSERRSTSAFPMRRTSRSPLSARSRRMPFSGTSRARWFLAISPKPLSCQASIATMK